MVCQKILKNPFGMGSSADSFPEGKTGEREVEAELTAGIGDRDYPTAYSMQSAVLEIVSV